MAAKKKNDKPKMCNCAATMNQALAAQNGELDLAVFILKGIVLPTVATVKKDPKVRQKPPVVICNYCPFCGQKYPEVS